MNKLKQVGTIKEVLYPEWLTNTVVLKKKNGEWRVCVGFTDLNKTCPKDHFLIPQIDQLVDTIVGHPRMSFLDAFQGYHQIHLVLDDQEITAALNRFISRLADMCRPFFQFLNKWKGFEWTKECFLAF